MSSTRILSLAAALAALCWLAPARAEDHRQYADSKPEDCAECHRGSGVMENHGVAFQTDHRLAARRTPSNCGDCHLESWCSDCHHGGNLSRRPTASLSRRGEPTPRSHASDAISTHAIKAAGDARSCARCHEVATFCSDCHTRQIGRDRAGMAIRPHAPTFTGGLPDPAWAAAHRREARRNLASCQACHPRKADCSNTACHPSLGGR
jgi:hypothetical protein